MLVNVRRNCQIGPCNQAFLMTLVSVVTKELILKTLMMIEMYFTESLIVSAVYLLLPCRLYAIGTFLNMKPIEECTNMGEVTRQEVRNPSYTTSANVSIVSGVR
jgi:hypothetical protein